MNNIIHALMDAGIALWSDGSSVKVKSKTVFGQMTVETRVDDNHEYRINK